ncbi:MAG: hypothetical protein KC996_09275 [Phycisphaerales bacterium]|nr:hypothetical protein [Phycisphaerales bacterium]
MLSTLGSIQIDPAFWIWLGALVVVVVVAGIALIAIRRRMFSESASADMQAGGLLEQMRVLRDQGKMSDKEYEDARRSLIERVSASKPIAASEPTEKN